MVVETLPARPRYGRLRNFIDSVRIMASDALDGTASFRRRNGEDGESPSYRSGGGITLPPGLVVGFVLYLVAQGVGGIWWAATMQSRIDVLIADKERLWQKVEVLDLQNTNQQGNIDERIRGRVREALSDWGYIHVPRKGGE